MLRYKPIRILLMMAFCGLTVTSPTARVGAVGDTFKESGVLRKRAAKASGDVDKYVIQLDKTARALSLVSQAQNNDLRKRYQSFSKEVKKLEEAQARATSEIDKVKTAGAQYFSSWDKSNAQISDPELRQASAERRSTVMKDYQELADSLSEIGLQLQPFMSNLRDLKASLGADLSPTNVDKASQMIQASQTDARALKDKIAVVQTTLKRFLSETPK